MKSYKISLIDTNPYTAKLLSFVNIFGAANAEEAKIQCAKHLLENKNIIIPTSNMTANEGNWKLDSNMNFNFVIK